MPASIMCEVDGTRYTVPANGRAKACEQAVRMHTGYAGRIKITFTRYVSGGVIYLAETAAGAVLEILVIHT